jgi:ABC-type lipoprotein release transport system permease subunit
MLGLSLLVGVACGAVMLAGIGARRAQTAYPRLLESTRAADVHVNLGTPLDDPRFAQALRHLPQVTDLGLVSASLLAVDTGPGRPRFGLENRVVGLMSADRGYGQTVDRPLILAGRRPDPNHPDEVALGESVARYWRVRPGDTIRLRALAPAQLEQAGPISSGQRPTVMGPQVTLKVVAIQRLDDDLNVPKQTDPKVVYLTLAFYQAYHTRIAHFPPEPVIRLKRGQADVAAFTVAAAQLLHGSSPLSTSTRADRYREVEATIGAQAGALVLFAVLAALAALVVIGQMLAREVHLTAADHPILRALGMGRPQLFALAVLPMAVVGTAGGLLGAVFATLASPLMPIGLARQADPNPGLTVHLAGLGVGLLATLLLITARAAVTAWRVAGARADEADAAGHGSASLAVADAAARTGLPPSAVVGVRMALERGRGPTAVPVATALVGVTCGIVALAAASTFSASLDRLLVTPRLYGWDFDAIAGSWRWDHPASRRPQELTTNPHIGTFSPVYFPVVTIGGTSVPTAGVDTTHGALFPTMVTGREPRAADEIALGAKTLRQIGRRVGQTVQVTGRRSASMRIVGQVAAYLATDVQSTANGAVVTLDGLQRLDADPESGFGAFYIRFATNGDPRAALRSLREPRPGMEQDVLSPSPPIEVENLRRVGKLPDALVGLLALLAAAALTDLLVTSVRRRRRDLAILKTLGFVRRQVSATVAWQATTVALVALLVGMPVGVATGRWAWNLLVGRLGLDVEPVSPSLALLACVVGVALVANLVAAGPGRLAARTRPAITLRAE